VAAIALRQKGLRVTVADGSDFPRDKACGEGILPEGLAALERMKIALDPTEGRAFHGIRFVNEHSSAEAVSHRVPDLECENLLAPAVDSRGETGWRFDLAEYSNKRNQ